MLLLCESHCICSIPPPPTWPSGTHTALPEGPQGHLPSARPQRVCALHSCQLAFPWGGRCALQGIWVGAPQYSPWGRSPAAWPPGEGHWGGGQPILRQACWGRRVWDPRGARRADAWQELYLEGAIWFPPRMLQQAVPRAGPDAACAAPEHQHPPPRPHTTLCSFFPPCFSFLRAVKRCSLPVTVSPPSLPPSCWSKPPSWNSPAD